MPQASVAKGVFELKSLKEIKMDGIQRQTLDNSCGAAALSILLKDYFNDFYEESDLLADIISRSSKEELRKSATYGFSLLDLKSLAERLGYKADGVTLPEKSIFALPGPVIILLKGKKVNHFVVLKGTAKGSAFIADPIQGSIRMPLHKLYDIWDGVALILSRKGFGLPKSHKLSMPKMSSKIAPERQIVRHLRHSPY